MLLSCSRVLYAQTSTQGTDFWLSFGKNRHSAYEAINMQVRIVTDQAATVTFTYTSYGIMQTYNIPAGSVRTINLNSTEKSRVFSGATGKTKNSLHITSTTPVSVYALNQNMNTSDATNILPVSNLGSDYYHISYKACYQNVYYDDGYTVIATENNTTIYDEGTAITTLQKGEVYSSYYSGTDKTGKHITSSEPIAYFVTNGGVFIPTYLDNGSDCLFQQLLPVNSWGNNFLVPVTHRGSERVRIVASQDGTVITQTGGVIINDNGGFSQNSLNLNKGQFVELEIYLGSCGCYISSNKPVGVGAYLEGYYHYSPNLLVNKGDPALTWVPPIQQSINGALIAPFLPTENTALDEHYALVVTPTATKNQTTIATGTSLPVAVSGGSWCDNSTSNYSFYSLQLSNNPNDSYFIANPYGLVVLGYGLGNAESYYYLSGAAARNLDAAFYVNNIHYQDLDGGIICDTVADFRALVQYAMSSTPGYLKWYVDSVLQTAVTDTLQWRRNLSVGKHTVHIDVLDMNNDTITISAEFTVGLPYYDTINDTICLRERYQNAGFDTIPKQAGFISYSQNLKTTIGCDSIITLNLTVNPSYYDTINRKICLGEQYNEYGFDTIPTQVGFISYSHNLKTVNNCDSITTLNLTINPVYYDTINDTICLRERYQNAGFDTIPTQAGFISYSQNLKTVNDCDSIITLNLTVNPSYYDTINDTICLGERYNDANFDTIPTQAGFISYSKKFSTALNCDSIITLNLTVNPVYFDTINATICLGERYNLYNFDTIPTQPGFISYSHNLKTVSNCDSITTLNLTINPVYFDTIRAIICLGEPYNQRGFNLFPLNAGSGIYKQELKTINYCDSIIVLILLVNPSYHDTIVADICLDENYNNYGFNVIPTQPGFFTYTQSYKTPSFCDSTITLQLTVNPIYNFYITDTIYEDEFYVIDDNNKYNTPGSYIAKLQTHEGCDSIINLNLHVIYYPPEITAFSPFNYDGVNDYLFPGFRIQVFNRYGTLIYETRSKAQQKLGWDGKNFIGKDVEPGLYFYILYNSTNKPRIKSSVEVLK